MPELALRSNLSVLSAFAGGAAYGSPELDLDAELLLDNVRQDVTDLFAICGAKANYDPWKVGKGDFQRGA